MTRPREEWRSDVSARYRALEQFSKEDARLQFLRILRSLPYGNSIFFAVKRIEDPIGLLPAKLILGINKRGVHFFRCGGRSWERAAPVARRAFRGRLLARRHGGGKALPWDRLAPSGAEDVQPHAEWGLPSRRCSSAVHVESAPRGRVECPCG
jgi:hypothetical protein